MYHIIDSHTGICVSCASTRRRAQRIADKLDHHYGAVRYIVRPYA
jgi:hypothetical protein